jgi:osmotically-inducible protein OsmY
MIQISGRSANRIATDELLTRKAAQRDDESRVAATLQTTLGDSDATGPFVKRRATPRLTIRKGAEIELDVVADEIARSLETQLNGRLRDLSVSVEEGQFVLRGVSKSYHVKQIAQHLAMTVMDTRLLGRLVNEIEVHSIR